VLRHLRKMFGLRHRWPSLNHHSNNLPSLLPMLKRQHLLLSSLLLYHTNLSVELNHRKPTCRK
tara:strand:+ start:50519 stop:50707 length:189 start_codon:yes stop_codon:yes gene_type:complete